MSDGTAKKRDPKKWAEAKARARKKMGGHSLRAMQLAVKYYKDAGGTYEGKKSKDNKLSKWSKEDWQTKESTRRRKRNDLRSSRVSIDPGSSGVAGSGGLVGSALMTLRQRRSLIIP